MSDAPTPTQPTPARPSLAELFLAFAMVSLSGFGGALPWARRKIVDQKRWMTAEEFNEAFALAQFLPGPNVVNFSVVFGTRFGGAAGGAVTLAGLMGPPLILVTILAWLYDNYGGADLIGRMLSGILAAAIGLMVATMIKMAKPLFARGLHWSPLIAITAFVTVGLLHWSLPLVAIVLAPISIALAWVRP
jgi:chromate transporter